MPRPHLPLLSLVLLFLLLPFGDAQSPADPPKLPTPPPPPDTLNEPLLAVLIILGVVLFILLVVLVVYVVWLQKKFKDEQKAGDEGRTERMAGLMQIRKDAERQRKADVVVAMDDLKKSYHEGYVEHVKFIKAHDPEKFEQMKEQGYIRIDGEESLPSDDERDIVQELKQVGHNAKAFTEEELYELEMNTDKTNTAMGLKREMRMLKREKKERKKIRALEDEKLVLEQKMAELDLDEKMDELKALERKQQEREQFDNLRSSKRIVMTENGDYIISRMGGASMEYDLEPYDSEFDFDDRLPELPPHLDDMNPRGKKLKETLDQLRSNLDSEKFRNTKRENEIDRDITLVRLRLQQQNKRLDRQEREIERNKERENTSRNVNFKDKANAAANLAQWDVPKNPHEKVPHFITQPWSVEGVSGKHSRGKRRVAGGGEGRKPASHLIDYIADVMKDERAQEEAIVSGQYLEDDGVEEEDVPSPLHHGLHPDALPTSRLTQKVRDKRMML